jgi:hypothetical protein
MSTREDQLSTMTTVPVERPLLIGIIPVGHLEVVERGGRKDVDLEALARKLNNLQSLFEYRVISASLIMGEYTFDHGYRDETYYETMKDRIRSSEFRWAIAVTPEELEEGAFNRHSQGEGLGIVTVESYERFIPPDSSLLRYLAYLVLCESFCIVSGQHLEHREARYCLFDMCHRKSDLTECLRRPSIHNECVTRLRRLGFTNSDLEQAYRILRYVGKPEVLHILKQAVATPGGGFLVGVASGLLANLLVQFSPVWSVYVAIACLVGLVLLAVSRYSRARPRGRRRA